MFYGLRNPIPLTIRRDTLSSRLGLVRFITIHARDSPVSDRLSLHVLLQRKRMRECQGERIHNGTCLDQVRLSLLLFMRQNRETRSPSLRHPGAWLDPEAIATRKYLFCFGVRKMRKLLLRTLFGRFSTIYEGSSVSMTHSLFIVL